MSDVLSVSSLQTYFFSELEMINRRHAFPLSREYIFYASLVMEHYALSKDYFEKREGQTREKILGIKLLESENLEGKQKKKAIKDIGDTALFLCGYFSEAIKDKIVDENYYQQIGHEAYRRLDALEPQFMNQDSFFEKLSGVFSKVTNVMSLVFGKSLSKTEHLLCKQRIQRNTALI